MNYYLALIRDDLVHRSDWNTNIW